MKFCLLTSFVRQSGIANYSKSLVSHLNCDLFAWDFFGKLSITFSPIKNFFKLRKLGGEKDVVHVQYHLGEQGPLFLPLLWFVPGRWVVTLHEDHKNFPMSRFWVWWHNLWLRRVNKIIVHTEVHKNVLSQPLQKKTVVVPFGVNVRQVSEIKDVNKHCVLIPGFINRWKGIDLAIEAMPLVLEKFPDATLHVVGKAWDERYCKELENKICELHLEKSVFLVSEFITPEQYDAFMSECAVVVLPYWRITMSNVLAESVSYCKEIILSNIPPFKEYSKNKLHLFEHGDYRDLARKILEVFSGSTCKVLELAEEYAWPKVAKKHLEVYNSVVAKL